MNCEVLIEEIQISLKLEHCGANEVDIQHQRPRFHRILFLGRKAGVGVENKYHNILHQLKYQLMQALFSYDDATSMT